MQRSLTKKSKGARWKIRRNPGLAAIIGAIAFRANHRHEPCD